MGIGSQIRGHRRRLGISQDELARRLFVSRVTVSHWETSKTPPDVQSMLLLANLSSTTIDELVRGGVDEMRQMVEGDERRTKVYAVALATVEVVVITALAVTAFAGHTYLKPVLRPLLAVLVLSFSAIALVARRVGGDKDAKSASELLGAATGDSAAAARASGAAHGMRFVLQVFAGLAVAVWLLVVGGILFDAQALAVLAVALAATAALVSALFIGLLPRPAGTAAILPALWIAGAVALGTATDDFDSPRDHRGGGARSAGVLGSGQKAPG